MRKIWRVFKYEFMSVVSRRSFILGLILVPLLPTIIIGLVSLLKPKDSPDLVKTIVKEVSTTKPYGVVDESGLINDYPNWAMGQLIPFEDESLARQETQAGKLDGFYIVSADYVETGDVLLVKPEVSMVGEMKYNAIFEELIRYNLLDGDDALYAKLVNQVKVTTEYLDIDQADTRDQNDPSTFMVPFFISFFFYMLLIITSSMMLNSVTKEKENRTMEILLSSAEPVDIFGGKILARGLASLLQAAVWLATILLLAKLTNRTLNLPFKLEVPTAVFTWGIPYFLLGFLLYGSLMAGLGAMVPNTREGGQFSLIMNMPLILAYLALSEFVANPNSAATLFLSLFPLTSTIVMPTRLAIGAVPVWQLIVALLLLALTVWLVVRAAANLFSSQNLLSGQKFNLKTFFSTLVFGKKSRKA
ncbi:MAG TPA: ABC transporter permease [Anaerolineaceae bacterium]|nr:ABC transporter permease [Anaerolineaceae bacterium]